MIIKEIDLLNSFEFYTYKDFFPPNKTIWWLKEKGVTRNSVCCVHNGRVISDMPFNTQNSVRPALVVDELTAFPGDTIEIFGFMWTVLNDHLILCNDNIALLRYDGICNEWESSALQQFLNKWLKEQTEKTEEIVCVKNPTEFLLLESLYKKYRLNKIVFGYNGDCEAYFLFSPYTYSIQITHHDMKRHRKSPITFAEFCNLITGEKTDDN